MWNVFDTFFVAVTLVYFACRVRGLTIGDSEIITLSMKALVLIVSLAYVSQWGFDILATGACILLPRLAFFMVSNNMVIL